MKTVVQNKIYKPIYKIYKAKNLGSTITTEKNGQEEEDGIVYSSDGKFILEVCY